MTEPATQQMQCMEVWGGSQLAARGVAFGGLEAWVYSKPYGDAEHGGDVYYASSCATGRISRLLLADVMGHGEPVAATAAELRALMRRFVNHLDQTEFVKLLNQQFAGLFQSGVFATAVVATFFAPSRRLAICNAGHPRPIVYRVAKNSWEFLGHDGKPVRNGLANIPLGLIEMSEYDQFDLELEPGDCVVSYTDALTESHDAAGKMLGEMGVLRILQNMRVGRPQQIAETLLAEITKLNPENLSDDDVTVLVVRATGGQACYSVREKFGAFMRFSGTLLRSVDPRAERAPFPDAKLANLGGALLPFLGRRWRAPRG